MAESVRQLAFELTRSSLSEQESRLADLRARSGTILAAASIAGSFLATRDGDIDELAALAVFHEQNRDKLATLTHWFTVSCAALGAEVVLWTLSVTGTL